MEITAYDLALRFMGIQEIPGKKDNPQILSMLKLDGDWPEHDEVPWCSAFVNYIAWLLRLPRSKSLRARSWLTVGIPILSIKAEAKNDVVILKRGGGDGSVGPEVLDAPGHVGFFSGLEENKIWVLGGNQSDGVSVAPYHRERLLGIRRLI